MNAKLVRQTSYEIGRRKTVSLWAVLVLALLLSGCVTIQVTIHPTESRIERSHTKSESVQKTNAEPFVLRPSNPCDDCKDFLNNAELAPIMETK